MQQEKKYPMLPADDAVQNWFEGNIDKECSASSAIYKFRLWLESLQGKELGPIWLEADTKPEHNVGVLVFIPGEDNHITSGMWDISNEWVLLDEYRTPEEEVTHWMPLPAFPKGYTHDMLSDEWVSTLKAIAKEELANRPSKEGNKDAVEFAEWVLENNIEATFNDKGKLWVDYRLPRGENKFTSEQLYELFKKRNNG